ncbi:hypothetical protein Syun_006662 [Stephania yunnanensis]|uniref:Uncharacterized protein n=1 Tax=Stephania yunnanensis TaxID=152371 RepID=A0AAP0KXA5_9MAGN
MERRERESRRGGRRGGDTGTADSICAVAQGGRDAACEAEDGGRGGTEIGAQGDWQAASRVAAGLRGGDDGVAPATRRTDRRGSASGGGGGWQRRDWIRDDDGQRRPIGTGEEADQQARGCAVGLTARLRGGGDGSAAGSRAAPAELAAPASGRRWSDGDDGSGAVTTTASARR